MEPSRVLGFFWLLMIGWMFYASHQVVDAYFLPAINVFVERTRSSPHKWIQRWGEHSVAGATICALGCNGPELFSNWVSLYTGSSAGIGVVVGSEIFNLLVIIGCTVIAAPVSPLQLERVPFVRDVTFYALSIVLLYWALRDQAIQFYESKILLCASVLYVAAVYFTSDLIQCCPFLTAEKEAPVPTLQTRQTGRMGGIEVQVVEIVHSRMADSHAEAASTWHIDPQSGGIHAKSPQPILRRGKSQGMAFMFDDPDALLGPVLRYEDLKEVIYEHGLILLEFHTDLQHVTLKLSVQSSADRDELLRNLELYSKGRVWFHKYDGTIVGVSKRLWHTLTGSHNSLVFKLLALPEFLTLAPLALTLWLVDVKDVQRERLWPLCFAGSMCWLAVFSFLMLSFADQVQYNIPELPSSFLGLTVCAIGTSFPNAVASVLMARQNKPAAAVANALGSNVQNVFLAMALPWVVYGLQTNEQAINQDVAGLHEGVLWMMGTLILVVVTVLIPPVCSIQWAFGPVLVLTYLVYLIQASGETFGWWPALVP